MWTINIPRLLEKPSQFPSKSSTTCPKGTYAINIGRGKHLVIADLLNAIENDQLTGAALDVFRDKPLPENHSFWKNEKIMITQHTAGNVHSQSAVKKILQNYEAMMDGEELVDVVDVGRGS